MTQERFDTYDHLQDNRVERVATLQELAHTIANYVPVAPSRIAATLQRDGGTRADLNTAIDEIRTERRRRPGDEQAEAA